MTRHLGTAALALLLLATPALAAPGDPVADYGEDGFVMIPPADAPEVAPSELVIAPDGTAILDVGAGSVDFGISPVVITPPGSWRRLDAPNETCSASRAGMAADGTLFFAGSCETGSFLIRYTADLTVDEEWGDSATPGVINYPELDEQTVLSIDGSTILQLAGPNRTVVGRNLDGALLGSFPIDPVAGPVLGPSPLAIVPGTGSNYHVVGFTGDTTLGVVSGTLGGGGSRTATVPLSAEWSVADAAIARSGDLIVAYTERTAVGDNLHLIRIGQDGERDTAFNDPALEIPAFVEHIAVAELRTGDLAVLTSDGDLGNRINQFSAAGAHGGVLVDWLDLPAGPWGFVDMAVSPLDGHLLFSRAVLDEDNHRAEVWRFEGDTSGRFVDDDGSVFETDIEWIASTAVTRGCNPPSNDNYCPEEPVTRGQMAAFLARALELPDPATGNTFGDDDTSIFETDIEKLATAGVTRGCNPPTNDNYCPEEPVTRGQMAAFLARALELPDQDSIDFIDDDGSVHEDDIEKLAGAGITLGCNPPSNDMYCPNMSVTRAQMAAFLNRALG